MNLNDYLRQPGAMSVAQLKAAIGVKSDVQIRQWQHRYANRMPSPEFCVRIERATGSQVRRWDLRPDDWHLIWPELVDMPGAPVATTNEGARDAA